MLVLSNLFMTVAWYGHLKRPTQSLWRAILLSWGIAFFEYLVMVPANRWGSRTYSLYQLKIIQEAITIVVFIAFAFFAFSISPRWNHIAALACVLAAVAFAFWPSR